MCVCQLNMVYALDIDIPIFCTVCVSQVSEQQLNDAIAQAVENSKLRKDKSQWSIDGEKCINIAQSHTAFFYAVFCTSVHFY